MSRFTGARVKVLRALGVDLPGLTRKTQARRPFAPGQHGQARQRRKLSDFGKQLLEKQKLRFNYGIGERQFRRVVAEARRSRENSGTKLLELLERRLDNVVFRAGFAPTIPAARQLVSHGHFTVNGRRVTIPSMRVDVGDVVRPRERSTNLGLIDETLASPPLTRPDWITFEPANKTARVAAIPDASSVPFPIDVQLVIEYYAKRL